MFVKICGITNLHDAETAIAAGASAIGFIFYPPSPRYIAPGAAARIAAQMPARIVKVGVFVDESPARIEEVARAAGLDVAQLHGAETPATYPASLRVWKAFRIPRDTDFTLPETPAEAVLLDGPANGQGFDWSRAAFPAGTKVILAGGLDYTNVRQAIAVARPWGVDACSRIEAAPGRKDHDKMKKFIEAALCSPATH